MAALLPREESACLRSWLGAPGGMRGCVTAGWGPVPMELRVGGCKSNPLNTNGNSCSDAEMRIFSEMDTEYKPLDSVLELLRFYRGHRCWTADAENNFVVLEVEPEEMEHTAGATQTAEDLKHTAAPSKMATTGEWSPTRARYGRRKKWVGVVEFELLQNNRKNVGDKDVVIERSPDTAIDRKSTGRYYFPPRDLMSDRSFFNVSSGQLLCIDAESCSTRDGVEIWQARNGRWFWGMSEPQEVNHSDLVEEDRKLMVVDSVASLRRGGDEEVEGGVRDMSVYCQVFTVWHESVGSDIMDREPSVLVESVKNDSRLRWEAHNNKNLDCCQVCGDSNVVERSDILDRWRKAYCCAWQALEKWSLPEHDVIVERVVSFLAADPKKCTCYESSQQLKDGFRQHKGELKYRSAKGYLMAPRVGFFDATKFRDESLLPPLEINKYIFAQDGRGSGVTADRWRDVVQHCGDELLEAARLAARKLSSDTRVVATAERRSGGAAAEARLSTAGMGGGEVKLLGRPPTILLQSCSFGMPGGAVGAFPMWLRGGKPKVQFLRDPKTDQAVAARLVQFVKHFFTEHRL